jgi:hypothetical protein
VDGLQLLRRVIILDDGDMAAERAEGVVAGFDPILSSTLEPSWTEVVVVFLGLVPDNFRERKLSAVVLLHLAKLLMN